MTHAHGGLLVLLIALGLGAVCGNALVAVIRATARRTTTLDRFAPAETSRLALVGLLLPALLGGLAVITVMTVPALALLFPGLDHCTAHVGAPHVCFIHGTLEFTSPWEAAGVFLLGGGLAISLAKEFARVWRARRLASALIGSGGLDAISWTDDEVPFAFTVGLFRPRIVVSAGLRQVLSPRQLAAALAHEAAHVQHYDALVRVAVRIFSFLLVPSIRQPLTELLVLGQEKRADDVAAEAVGSRTLVAETLLALVRSRPHAPVMMDAPALVGRALESRVEALCREPARGRLSPKLLLGFAAVLMTFVGAEAQVHTSAEAVAGVLFSSPVHAHDDVTAGAISHPTRYPSNN